MRLRYDVGSIRSRIMIVIVAVILVAVGVLTTYWIINYNQEKDAKSFGSSFVATINNQDIVQGYGLLDPKLKESLGSINSWAAWAVEFKNGDLTINNSPKSISNSNNGINLSNSRFTITYAVSNNVDLQINVTYENNSWLVTNYAIR